MLVRRVRSRLFLSLLVLALCAGAGLSLALSRDAFLRGSDSYYYALQSDHWAATGEVKIPDSSPLHRFNGLLIRAGLNGESAIRLWVGLSLTALGAAAAWLVARQKASLILIAVFLWLLLSPSALFTALEFPKMFSCLILIPLWFLPLASRKPLWPLALLLAAATLLLHRAALPWVVVFSLSVLFAYGRSPLKLRVSWLATIFILALFAAAYVFFVQDRFRIVDFSRFSWQDVEPGLYTLLRRDRLPASIRIELIAAPLLLLVLAVRLGSRGTVPRRVLFLPFGLLLPALFPFGSAEIFAVGERFAICVPVLSLVGSLFLLGQAEAVPSEASEEDRAYREHFALGVGWGLAGGLYRYAAWGGLVLASLFLFAAAPQRLRFAHPLELDPPFAGYQRAVAYLQGKEIPMLIAHKGFVYFYKFRLKREAFPYEPEAHWNPARIGRVVAGLTPEEVNSAAGARCEWKDGLMESIPETDYFFVREDCWREIRAHFKREDDPALFEIVWDGAWNPSRPRPAFLYAKHRGDPKDEFSALP